MKIIKWLLLCGVALNVGAVFGACPWIDASDFSNGTVKRITPRWWSERNTIYFCKQPDVDNHMTIEYTKAEFLGDNFDGKFLLTDPPTKYASIGANTIEIDGGGGVKDLRFIKGRLAAKTIATSELPPWGEPSIFHFYKRIPWRRSCTEGVHNSIRDYLRRNLDIFTITAPVQSAALRVSENRWFRHDLVQMKNVDLTNGTRKIRGNIYFHWFQRIGGGTGGNWRVNRHRICHFAVSAVLEIEVNHYDTEYQINEAGDYSVTIGVRTQP